MTRAGTIRNALCRWTAGWSARRLRRLRPAGKRHWISALLLLTVFGAYLAVWFDKHRDFLTEPMMQNDDARTVLFPLHRYAPDPALADDPIAAEMRPFLTPGVWLLYRATVPFVGVLAAAKLVQAVALALLFAAGACLAATRRGGLAGGVLLVFLVLHTGFAVDTFASGLPRAFAFPCLMLWMAGALGNRPRVRIASALLAALTYPSAMAMILGAEGLFALRHPAGRRLRLWRGRLRRYALLVAGCVLLVLPVLLGGGKDRGPMHTLAQARREPAFGRAGRLKVLPFADPVDAFAMSMANPFRLRGTAIFPRAADALRPLRGTIPLVILAALLLLPLAGCAPAPRTVVAFVCGAAILYLLARVFAFRLYSPERYYSYGMRAAVMGLAAGVLGRLWPRGAPPGRAVTRNLATAAFLALFWLCGGDGIRPNHAMSIDGRRHAELYGFLRGLPKEIRVAAHINDADDIPLFAARATTGGHETLQPWWVDAWKRQKERAEDVLRMLYATRRETVLDFARRRNVTHILIDTDRYRGDIVQRALTFEPLSRYTRELLRGVRPADLVLAHPPPEAVVFREGSFLLLEVARLGQAWNAPP